MEDTRAIYEREFNTVWHICLAYMRNNAEAEDALQETFLRYMKYIGKKKDAFEDADPEASVKRIRSWLIVTAGNVCKDQLKNWWRKRESLEDYDHVQTSAGYEHDEMLEMIMNLPDKYKIPVYMYYYLGYDSSEIAKVLHVPKSTVRSRLIRARGRLKEELEKEDGAIKEGGMRYEN